MTSQSSSETPLPSSQERPEVGGLGSGIYGGRPNFALVRRDGADGGALTLYELLPVEQASARSDRLERVESVAVSGVHLDVARGDV